jgi:outer membrane receptor protein involved in Fe transport
MTTKVCLQRFVHLALVSVTPLTCWSQSSLSGPASPQAQNDGFATLQEVVVTAQKREERLIDVPISIAVATGDELKMRRITSLEDLPQVVPDLAYNNIGNNHYFEIRGISNLIGNAPLVGIYIDEADVTLGGAAATQVNPTLYDLERVEVLRGPQGTLYGEGSAGGTIRFVTRNPELNRFSFAADVAALFTEHGSPSQRINAVANIPLIEDQLGVRIVGTFEHDGGWIDQPAAGQKDINGRDLTNVRLKGLWKITPEFTASALAVINRSESGIDATDPGNPYAWTQAFNLTATPRAKNDQNLFNLTLAYDFSHARILNTTTYMKVEAPWTNQATRYQFTPPGTTPPFDYYAPIQVTTDHVLTDELRLTSVGTGPWQWTVGGFYRRYRDSTSIPFNYFDLPGPPGSPLPDPYAFGPETLYKSKSAFLDTSYRLWDRLTLGVGVRYFSDHQDFTDHIALTQQSGKFSSTDPRVYAQYKLSPDFNVYASAAKGFRSGGFNAAGQPAYGPESVWTYELGAKSAMLDGRLTADASVFWSKYTDYQTFGISDASTGENFIADVGSARIKGIEWDLSYRPVKQLRFDVRGDYLNARFTAINAESTNYAVGDPLDLVPRYQITASAQYDYSWRAKAGYARVDYSQQGPETSRNRSIGPWYYGESDVIHTLNFNTGLTWSENLQVGFFAQNLLNETGFANPYNYIYAGVRPRPRTFGVNFSVSLE